ncbi:HNH endonuclease [Streptomyces flaveolus]|uniref:HNH endonuclease n=1 Tax=Streptomyces flaveolus TaxID=67297 RepID=UPI003700992A
MSALQLVNSCPKWCTEDHTAQAEEDREHHGGRVHELRLPDGRVILEASLTVEPGRAAPQLVVAGSLESFADDVQLLDADQAQAFAAEVQRFASHVDRMAATVKNDRPRPDPPKRPNKRARKRLGPELQGCSREIRLYLAERDGMQCFYCRRPFDGLAETTKDHYVPKSLWPCNLPANLVLACRTCNLAKGDRLTWSMAAVLLAWAREGGVDGEANTTPAAVPAARCGGSLSSLAG